MRVEIENMRLVNIANFMYGLSLVRKQSRMRRRFIQMIEDRYKQVELERQEILKEHSYKDENGEAIIKEDNNYDIMDYDALAQDVNELNREKFVIEGGDNRELIKTMKEILRKFEDVEYEGQDSDTYDYLCDQFKIDEGENE